MIKEKLIGLFLLIGIILLIGILLIINTLPTNNIQPEPQQVSEQEWAEAVNYLRQNIDEENKQEVRTAINSSQWPEGYHLGYGITIRNMLREGGFDWGDLALEDNWVELVEEAVNE